MFAHTRFTNASELVLLCSFLEQSGSKASLGSHQMWIPRCGGIQKRGNVNTRKGNPLREGYAGAHRYAPNRY
jgi:hypothetical protein